MESDSPRGVELVSSLDLFHFSDLPSAEALGYYRTPLPAACLSR